MIDISKFIKDHSSLCVGTLGTAILGYLGYHIMRWIINKCQRTEKVDHVAQNQMNNLTPINSQEFLTNRVSDFEISPNKITMGQGEYIVFHKLPDGEKKELSSETFEKCIKFSFSIHLEN